MKEYDLFVPLSYNDGTPVEPAKFQELQSRLLDRFEGLTFFPAAKSRFLEIRQHHLSRRDRDLSSDQPGPGRA